MGLGCVSCETLNFFESIIFFFKVGTCGSVVLNCFLFPYAYWWGGEFPTAVDLDQIVLFLVCGGDCDATAEKRHLLLVEALFETPDCYWFE